MQLEMQLYHKCGHWAVTTPKVGLTRESGVENLGVCVDDEHDDDDDDRAQRANRSDRSDSRFARESGPTTGCVYL